MAEYVRLGEYLVRTDALGQPVCCSPHPVDKAEFMRLTAAWADCFARQAGARWALYCDDSLHFAAALLGAWQAGKTVYLPGDTQAATLQRLALQVDGFAGDFPASCAPLDIAGGATFAFHPLADDYPALVVFTSGSTGEPLAIAKNLGQLEREIVALEQSWGGRLGDAQIFATVSHQHIYGLLFKVLWPLSTGRAFAGGRLVFPEEMIAVLAASCRAALIASPAHLKRLPEHLDWHGVRDYLRAVFSSGGLLSQEASLLVRRTLGQCPVEVFGSSETGGIAWRQRKGVLDDSDAVWQPLPGVSVRLAEEECLAIRSPHLPDTQWFQTQDRAQLAAEGGFRLLGRADRIVKVEEKRVSLTALERRLLATGLLSEAKVCVLEDERASLAVAAVPTEQGWQYCRAHGKAGLNAALRQALLAEVEATALPRRWCYVASLPLDTQGKTRIEALQALFDPRRPSYEVLAIHSDRAEVELQVKASSPFFKGHFPAAPILPGVTQIEWAIMIARDFFELPAAMLRMENIKFKQTIRPAQKVSMQLEYCGGGADNKAGGSQKRHLGFVLTTEQGVCASGRIIYEATVVKP